MGWVVRGYDKPAKWWQFQVAARPSALSFLQGLGIVVGAVVELIFAVGTVVVWVAGVTLGILLLTAMLRWLVQ